MPTVPEPAGPVCSDAERRGAVAVHDHLRALGHEPFVETLWVRPQDAWVRGLHALLAVVASLLAVSEPIAGAAIAGAVVLSLLVEIAGRTSPLRALFFRRATQVVLTEPEDPDAVALWIVARTDRPRRGTIAHRLRHALATRLVPGPLAWIALLVGVIGAAAGARIGGVEGVPLGLIQFIPTTILLLVAAAALDTAGGALEDPDFSLAAAIELHRELTLQPPAHLSPSLRLGGPHAIRRHLRAEKPPADAVVVLELVHDAATTLTTKHPQLVAAARANDVALVRAPGPSRRLPSAVLAGEGEDLITAALAVVDELDAQLAAAGAPAANV